MTAERSLSIVVSLAGIGVRVESNSAVVIDAFASRYGAATSPASDAPLCNMSVHVAQGDPVSVDDVEARWRYPDGDRSTVTGPGFSGSLNMSTGRATVHADETFVRGHPLFRRAVLEGIPLTIINRMDRHPVHAASVRMGNAAILLQGDSGVGKSTLAYVAHRSGIQVLADDSTRVQLNPELRVWGEGPQVSLHLLVEARTDFAELRELTPDWLSAGGTEKLSVRVQSAPGSRLPFATEARVCLLSRDATPVSLRPASSAEIRSALLSAPEAGADRSPTQRVKVAEALSERGGWHLKLSSNPADAIPALREMLAHAAEAGQARA